MEYVISEQANKFFVLANLAEWHFSFRKPLNKYLLATYGKLNNEERCKISSFKELLMNHGTSLGRFFYQRKITFGYPEFQNILNQQEFDQLKVVFGTLEDWWGKVWGGEEKCINKWKEFFTAEDYTNLSQSIVSDLQLFFGTDAGLPDEVYLLISNPGGCGGGANIGLGKVTLECSGLGRKDINRVLGTLWHEITHLFYNASVRDIVKEYIKVVPLEFLDGSRFMELKKGIKMPVFFSEAVAHSLFPSGYLASKYLNLYSQNAYNSIFVKKKPNVPFLHQWGVFAAYKLTDTAREYIRNGKQLDNDFLDAVVQTLEKFVKLVQEDAGVRQRIVPEQFKKWLQEGKQTKPTQTIKDVVNDIEGEDLYFVVNALRWVLGNIKWENKHPQKMELFRKRTASQIIEDGFSTGCSDNALVLTALCRAKGIPTKYVETIDRGWLEDGKDSNIQGHVYVEVFVNGGWYNTDPTKGLLQTKKSYNGRVIFEKGLDSWDLGIRDYDSMKNLFLQFRKKYRQS